MKLKRGILIAIEGIDGSGKSTLAHNLSNALTKKEFPVLLTKEPGGTVMGTELRTILQHQQTPIAPKAEFLLFVADRAQHFYETVIPHLEKNYIVISDRMADSSLVYQGYGRGINKDIIKTINAWAMNNIIPDITVYVHVPYEVAQERIEKRGNLSRFEKEHKTFTKKLIAGFADIAAHNPQSITLDGTLSEETLVTLAMEEITQWIQRNN